jgi:hypothetical protein
VENTIISRAPRISSSAWSVHGIDPTTNNRQWCEACQLISRWLGCDWMRECFHRSLVWSYTSLAYKRGVLSLSAFTPSCWLTIVCIHWCLHPENLIIAISNCFLTQSEVIPLMGAINRPNTHYRHPNSQVITHGLSQQSWRNVCQDYIASSLLDILTRPSGQAVQRTEKCTNMHVAFIMIAIILPCTLGLGSNALCANRGCILSNHWTDLTDFPVEPMFSPRVPRCLSLKRFFVANY